MTDTRYHFHHGKSRRLPRPADPLLPGDAHLVAEYLRHNFRHGELYRLFFLTGCNTGLRASDLRRLTVGQMDAGRFTIEEKKTGKTREIVLNAAIRQVYREYRKTAGVLFWADDAFVFELQRGESACVKYAHWLISGACTALGIDGNFGSHTMRKSFAREIYRKTKSKSVIKMLLHHSKISVTELYIPPMAGEASSYSDSYPDDQNLWPDLAVFYNLISFI